VYQASVQHLFDFDPVAIGPTGSFLYRDHNGYNPTTLQFVPAKTRWSAGLMTQYAATKTISLNAKAEHIWIYENATPAFPNGEMYSILEASTVTAATIPAISSNGWQFSIGLTGSL
jgi:hypothetical protein